jgi:translation elongation factor EF-G
MTYASTLKSITGGLGTYTMEFAHAEPAPPSIQAECVAAYKPIAHES